MCDLNTLERVVAALQKFFYRVETEICQLQNMLSKEHQISSANKDLEQEISTLQMQQVAIRVKLKKEGEYLETFFNNQFVIEEETSRMVARDVSCGNVIKHHLTELLPHLGDLASSIYFNGLQTQGAIKKLKREMLQQWEKDISQGLSEKLQSSLWNNTKREYFELDQTLKHLLVNFSDPSALANESEDSVERNENCKIELDLLKDLPQDSLRKDSDFSCENIKDDKSGSYDRKTGPDYGQSCDNHENLNASHDDKCDVEGPTRSDNDISGGDGELSEFDIEIVKAFPPDIIFEGTFKSTFKTRQLYAEFSGDDIRNLKGLPITEFGSSQLNMVKSCVLDLNGLTDQSTSQISSETTSGHEGTLINAAADALPGRKTMKNINCELQPCLSSTEVSDAHVAPMLKLRPRPSHVNQLQVVNGQVNNVNAAIPAKLMKYTQESACKPRRHHKGNCQRRNEETLAGDP